MKKTLEKLITHNVILRKLARFLLKTVKRVEFNILSLGKKIDKKSVLFVSFGGRSYCDSPKAVYLEMLNNKEYNSYRFIWAFKNPEEYKFLEDNKNTKVIKFGTKDYKMAVIKSKFWVSNFRMPDYIYPKKEQVYVECWHGTPLKLLGYDIKNSDNAMNSKSEIVARYDEDAKKFKYLLSPSDFTTKVFKSAWGLKDESKILEIGYPRNDYLLNYKSGDIQRIKRKLNIRKDKKVILYAPTWRDNQHKAGVGYFYEPEADFDYLKDKLSEECVILFRAHYLIANSFNFEKFKGFVYDVSKVDDINELYIISDLLITDYSSVFFDYANLKRPMLFYMYDIEQYRDEIRGFYIDTAELPGPIVTDKQSLAEEIKNCFEKFVVDDKYIRFNNKFNHLDDGNASKRFLRVFEEVN